MINIHEQNVVFWTPQVHSSWSVFLGVWLKKETFFPVSKTPIVGVYCLFFYFILNPTVYNAIPQPSISYFNGMFGHFIVNSYFNLNNVTLG